MAQMMKWIDSETPINALVEVNFFQLNLEVCERPPISLERSQGFRDVIVENLELVGLAVFSLYVISFIMIYYYYRKKNVQLEQARSLDETTSRKFSSDSFRADSNDNEGSQNSSTAKLGHQLVPYKPTENKLEAKEIIVLEGQQQLVRKEIRVEVERDPETKNYMRIETQTLVTEIQASPETEESLLRITKQIGQDGSFKGMRLIEHEDYQKQTQFKQVDVLTDMSKLCENGRFKKQYTGFELLGKGTYGEVFKVSRILDSQTLAIKRIYFRINDEIRVLKEVKSLALLNNSNIVRYFGCWVEEIEIELLIKFQDKIRTDKKPLSVKQSSNNTYVDDSNLGEFVQFVGGGESEKSIVLTKSKSFTITNNNNSFHPSELSSESMESLARRIQYKPKSLIYVLHIEMELCSNRTLRDYIDKWENSIEASRWIFKKIVEGLHYIHEQGLIHRDLKPANIFMDNKLRPKIGDFGLTCAQADSSDTKNAGSPLYMAPEVKNGVYSVHTDMYALGIILFEMFYRFKTGHQRNRLIKELVENRDLPSEVKALKESKWIFELTSAKAQNRPTTVQILQEL